MISLETVIVVIYMVVVVGLLYLGFYEVGE